MFRPVGLIVFPKHVWPWGRRGSVIRSILSNVAVLPNEEKEFLVLFYEFQIIDRIFSNLYFLSVFLLRE